MNASIRSAFTSAKPPRSWSPSTSSLSPGAIAKRSRASLGMTIWPRSPTVVVPKNRP